MFDLGNVDYVNKTNERDEQLGEQNLKDGSGAGLPKLNTTLSKNPALSASLLRGLIGSNAMAVISSAGNAELLNKVTEFANEILLSPDDLTDDIIRQQKITTKL